MSGIRRSIPSVLVVAAPLLVGLASSCGTGEQTSTHEVYVRLDCGKCHGYDREGARTAPPLKGLASRWDREGLVEYLRDPAAVTREKPRIALRNEEFPLKMPAFANVAEGDLIDLADYLLKD